MYYSYTATLTQANGCFKTSLPRELIMNMIMIMYSFIIMIMIMIMVISTFGCRQCAPVRRYQTYALPLHSYTY